MAYKTALHRISFFALIAAIGLLATGIDACQDDFCVGCEASVPTLTPTVTATATDEGNDEEDPDATPTTTPTATTTGTPSTPTPTITGTVSASSIGRKVSDGRTLLEGIPSGSGLTDLRLFNSQKKGPFIDADKDGFSDDLEISQKTDPKDPKSVPQLKTSLDARINTDDTDQDGLIDSEEITLGTDPKKPDTDGDGLRDDMERIIGTDPLVVDSDNDGATDGAEVGKGADPLKADWQESGTFKLAKVPDSYKI